MRECIFNTDDDDRYAMCSVKVMHCCGGSFVLMFEAVGIAENQHS